MSIADYLKNDINNWPNWVNRVLLRLNIFGKHIYGPSYHKLKNNIYNESPEKMLLKMVNFAIENVPYYRQEYGSLKVKSIKEFEEKIGFIDKDIVMANWDKFLVDNIDFKKCKIGYTGGTSGKPLKVLVPLNRYIRESVFIHSVRKCSGWQPGKTKAVIRNHRLPKGRLYMINPITKDLIFDAFRIDETYSLFIYNTLKSFNIKFIHAYPSALYQFFKICDNKGYDLSFIKSCLLSSEMLTEEQAWFFTKKLNLKVSYTYGHSEKLILAANNCENTNLLVDPYYGYFELIDKDGKNILNKSEIGEMVGTTFFNYYMPLIRYKTGDYAEFEGVKKCTDGIQRTTLKTIYGRWDKSLVFKSNGTTTTLTALNLHGNFYNHINGIQYIQQKKGYITVLIIKNENYTDQDEAFIYDYIGNAMGGKEYVQVQYVNKLIYKSNGKFLPLVSYL
jgi:phenylacetate-CoA ligase